MNKILFPRLKLSRPKHSAFWILEDLANNSPKFLLMKSDLEDLRGQIDNALNNFIKGGRK